VSGQAFLVRDNWDDYSFKTTFQLLLVDPGGKTREIGGVKIGRFGMTAPAKQGLVHKEASWGAWVRLQLSDLGAQAAHTLLACRSDVLRQALDRLDDSEREHLGQLLSKVLAGLYRQPGDAERICRLCDRCACVQDGATCPVGQADRDHRASHERNHG
jgi:hypothetical protein